MSKTLPRGIRNANPGNIELGDPWQGLRPRDQQTDGRFAQFTAPTWGIRALARTLITYQDKHGIRTVRDIIHRWAPPVENDTGTYVNAVTSAVAASTSQQINPTSLIDVHDYATLSPIVEAIIRHENGRGPLKTANTWYGNDVIDEALHLAGITKPAPVVAKLPVTRETVAATGVGGVGVAQIAEVAPAVLSAIENSDDHLSSGSIVRIVVAVLTIGLAAFIAWSQIKKHQAGVVA